jgi:hypothetical protein
MLSQTLKRTWSAIGSANSVGKPTLYERGCHRPIFPHHWLKQSACGRACWPMPDDMAEVAVPRHIFLEILSLIAQLRAPPAPA